MSVLNAERHRCEQRTGTFQTEKAGNVTFFRTEDAPEPVQLIVEMEELPKPVRSQLHVESALRQTVR